MAFPRSMLTPTRECHAIPYQPRPHRGIEAFQNHGFRAPHVCSSHIIVTFRLVTPPWRLLVPCFRRECQWKARTEHDGRCCGRDVS
jgi:hypothetical protein